MTTPSPTPMPPGAPKPATPSVTRATGRFVLRHPLGAIEVLLSMVVGIVVLQNLEPTRLDVLFWSFAEVPKLALLVGAMVVGALLWEIFRRLILRAAAKT